MGKVKGDSENITKYKYRSILRKNVIRILFKNLFFFLRKIFESLLKANNRYTSVAATYYSYNLFLLINLCMNVVDY